MTSPLEAELDSKQAAAHTAYRRFITSAGLLQRRGLSGPEAIKALAICSEAFDALTVSLARIQEICNCLYPMEDREPIRHRMPRYSRDARRDDP